MQIFTNISNSIHPIVDLLRLGYLCKRKVNLRIMPLLQGNFPIYSGVGGL